MKTPRTDNEECDAGGSYSLMYDGGATSRVVAADFARQLEHELQVMISALRGMMAEFDHKSRVLDPEISTDIPRIAARAALEGAK